MKTFVDSVTGDGLVSNPACSNNTADPTTCSSLMQLLQQLVISLGSKLWTDKIIGKFLDDSFMEPSYIAKLHLASLEKQVRFMFYRQILIIPLAAVLDTFITLLFWVS